MKPDEPYYLTTVNTLTGLRIAQLRQMQQMSCATLAAKLKINAATLARWESGRSNIPASYFPRIYDAFQMMPNFFWHPIITSAEWYEKQNVQFPKPTLFEHI